MVKRNISSRAAINRDLTSWFRNSWRPAMGWQWLIVCLFDFILAQLCLGWYALYTNTPLMMWHPITMVGGGLYHIAMGGVVGVNAWTRSLEKSQIMKHVLDNDAPDIDVVDKDTTDNTNTVDDSESNRGKDR